MNDMKKQVRVDATTLAVIIEGLTIEDADVVAEARHWVTGERGAACEDDGVLTDADVTKFATEAIVLGAKALTLTAQTTETRALERMVKEVGDKTAEASRQAGAAAEAASKAATDTVAKAAEDAKTAIVAADEVTRKHLSQAVAQTKADLVAETRRLFGGETPEFLERMEPVLDRFAVSIEKRAQATTAELLEKATKQLDPSDPTSPMARHAVRLSEQQEKFSEQVGKGQTELASKVDALATALKIHEAETSLASVTPIKGGSLETQVHALMTEIAVGLGDEYEDTTTKTGLVSRSKKGDGLLTVSGQDARVVVEMTDSARNNWGAYFDEAERNRGASAALGVVRTIDQNGGHSIRVLGQRRVVIAFDPDEDDAEVLRTVVLLLRTVAMAAAARSGDAEIDTAEEKIGEAIDQLGKIDSIKKTAGLIVKNAGKIESECTTVTTSIRRLLDQALVSLAGSETRSTEQARSAVDGAA